jgi:hypothetical protein
VASIVDPPPDGKTDAWRANQATRTEAHYAGLEAARDMPFDWYCPRREYSLPRRECVQCVAEVALDAAMAVLFGDDR